ncbi:STAS domain-containing protein [bacterium]|nr:STAS domain-containing protein [bacterium]
MTIDFEFREFYYYGKVCGEFTFDNEENLFKEFFNTITAHKEKYKGQKIYLVVDFEDMDFISSSGIAIFDKIYKFVDKKGGIIKFINLPSRIKEIFDFLKVPFAKAIAQSLEDAVKNV